MLRDGYSADATKVHNIYGMGISYCQSLSAAIFHGNSNAVNYTTFNDDESGIIALNNRTVDVLVGLEANLASDFGTKSHQGVTFSVPYYISNGTGK
jgi:hypothetical protein